MADVNQTALVSDGAIPPDDFHTYIERMGEVADYQLEVPADLSATLARYTSHLLVEPDVVLSAAIALISGNLVLQGPPGTGKSSLARALCRAFRCAVLPVTAHEDWSVFEVIGRQELRVDANGREEILPVNGFFTEAAIRCAGRIVDHFDHPEEPQAEWLLIDELNRAHLDRAFGELFTVLGTDETVPITLPHQPDGNRVIVTPKRFRIIATLNSVDRQFVNSLSQGLRRRFSFITFDIPKQRKQGEAWSLTPHENSSLAVEEFSLVLQRASERVSVRLSEGDEERRQATLDKLTKDSMPKAMDAFSALFDLVEKVRYANVDAKVPHLPIGTASLIDTVELVLLRSLVEANEDYSTLTDWGASLKIAPAFDADLINSTDLEDFIKTLPAPFDRQTKTEIAKIVAAGLYYIE